MADAPVPASPASKLNRIGLAREDYKGLKTTLCAGCGHNAISERIVEAMYDMGVAPERVAKFSGIGCSSNGTSTRPPVSWSSSAAGSPPCVRTGRRPGPPCRRPPCRCPPL